MVKEVQATGIIFAYDTSDLRNGDGVSFELAWRNPEGPFGSPTISTTFPVKAERWVVDLRPGNTVWVEGTVEKASVEYRPERQGLKERQVWSLRLLLRDWTISPP
jgi:hypothetical protein